MIRTLGSLLGGALLLMTTRADAEGPSDEDVSRRLAFLEARLDRGTAAADRWFYGWYAGYTLLSVGQLSAAVALTNRGLRTDAAVAGASASLGVLALALFPFTPRTAAGTLAAFPEATPEERRAKLSVAERILHQSAEREVRARSWVTHVLGITVSVGTGLFLALAYNRAATGALTTLGGITLTEAQIFTAPTAAIDDEREYQRLEVRASTPERASVTWTVAPAGGGISLVGAF